MLRTIGFPISLKENEHRRAIIPEHLFLLKNPQMLWFEKGYGEVCGYSDNDYIRGGANVASREEILKCDIICDPKIGDADYLDKLYQQTIFGWVHATQNRDITDKIIKKKLTAFAWEKMHYKGRHIFWKNNELAGEAAVLHSFQCYGRMPYETSVAVIGKGNTARGAIKILNMLGANVTQYDRKTEKLFREEIGKYDVIINCILWDLNRLDHIIYRNDLSRMKKHSMIVDVSCDKHGGIETSVPTSIEAPTYYVDGILHYAVDHTPALFYKSFTQNNSEILWSYIDELISENYSMTLKDSLIIENGVVIDQEINIFQRRE